MRITVTWPGPFTLLFHFRVDKKVIYFKERQNMMNVSIGGLLISFVNNVVTVAVIPIQYVGICTNVHARGYMYIVELIRRHESIDLLCIDFCSNLSVHIYITSVYCRLQHG